MKDIIEELYLTNRSFVTDDYDYCLNYIDENILPLNVHKFASGKEIWDSWVIPPKWSVNHAFIKKNGKEIIVEVTLFPIFYNSLIYSPQASPAGHPGRHR